MLKFKTLFRKSHGSSTSGSGGGNSAKNKNNVTKAGRFESAVSVPQNSNANAVAAGSCSDEQFEKAPVTVTRCVYPVAAVAAAAADSAHSLSQKSDIDNFSTANFYVEPTATTEFSVGIDGNNSPSKMFPEAASAAVNADVDVECIRRELESVVNEKCNLELTLQKLVHSHGELETLRKEIETLKEQRDEIQSNLLLRIGQVDPLPSVENAAKNGLNRSKKLPNSAPASIAPPSDSTEMLDAHDWDKHSSSSLSEVSVACLQDRIMQMEETHYSTSEELQATLQELADLQTQLLELQTDNERLGEEKGVLLESLCRQTEKLEDARSKVGTLQDLLLDSNKSESSFSEREQKLVLLLKDSQQERETLLIKQKELVNELEELNRVLERHKQESFHLKERVNLLESTVEATNAERSQIEQELTLAKEDSSCKCIEISRLSTLLENARCKIEEMENARDKQADKGELDDLIDTLRKEKDHLEIKLASLQEQLSKSMCEVVKLKEQFLHSQEENRVTRNNAKSALNDLEYKCQKHKEEADRFSTELHELRENYLELEVQCQCHVDDKKQLKSVLLETQQHLAESNRQHIELKQSLEDEKKLRLQEQSEWEQFQNDLLMTVRVANDLKTEAQSELQRLVLENKQLRDKIKILETKIQTLMKVDSTPPPLLHRSFSSSDTSSIISSVMSQEITRRNHTNKMMKQDNRLSVKSLIESIENATKQAKTGNACSRSDSASSLNNLTNQLSGSSTPNADIDISSLAQLKDNFDLHLSPKCIEERLSPNNPILSSAKTIEFTRKSSANDLSERKDPLQALVKNGGSKRNALLKWCQNKTVGYTNIDITNFSSSWNDGMALCALLHSYLPDKVPYDTLNPADKKRNFSIAFAAAESVGIKTTLSITDMIQEERPDWNQVMAYVTAVFRHFES